MSNKKRLSNEINKESGGLLPKFKLTRKQKMQTINAYLNSEVLPTTNAKSIKSLKSKLRLQYNTYKAITGDKQITFTDIMYGQATFYGKEHKDTNAYDLIKQMPSYNKKTLDKLIANLTKAVKTNSFTPKQEKMLGAIERAYTNKNVVGGNGGFEALFNTKPKIKEAFEKLLEESNIQVALRWLIDYLNELHKSLGDGYGSDIAEANIESALNAKLNSLK